MTNINNEKSWGGLKEGIDRIYILTKMQLKNIKKKKVQNNSRKVLSFLFSLLTIFLVTLGLYFIFKYLSALFAIGFILSSNFLIFYITVLQITSIVSCTISMTSSLFLDNDNILLLSYPCRHSEVFLSKLLVQYISELKKSLFGLLPLILVIGILTKESIYSELPFVKLNYFLYIPLVILLLPLIPVLFGSLISLPCSYLKRFINSSSIAEVISILFFVVIIYVLSMLIASHLPDRIAIITEYITFISKIKSFIDKISIYCLYNRFFVLLLFNQKPLLNLLFILLLIILGVLLVTLIIMPFYFSLASHSMEFSRETKHKIRNKTNKTVFRSFINKELLESYRDVGKTITNYLFILLMPPVIFLIASIYSKLSLNLSTGPMYISIFILLFMMLMTLSSNTDIATSITREGSEFVLLKTAPTKTEKITWAKMIVSSFYILLTLTFSFILLFIMLKINDAISMLPNMLMLYILILITNIGEIFKGMELDLMSPSLTEYASTKSVKENKNVSRILEEGLVLSILYTLIYAILRISLNINSLIPLILVSIIYLVIRIFGFKRKLFAFFDDIEV